MQSDAQSQNEGFIQEECHNVYANPAYHVEVQPSQEIKMHQLNSNSYKTKHGRNWAIGNTYTKYGQQREFLQPQCQQQEQEQQECECQLIPPISTYVSIRNCSTPAYLNTVYSYQFQYHQQEQECSTKPQLYRKSEILGRYQQCLKKQSICSIFQKQLKKQQEAQEQLNKQGQIYQKQYQQQLQKQARNHITPKQGKQYGQGGKKRIVQLSLRKYAQYYANKFLNITTNQKKQQNRIDEDKAAWCCSQERYVHQQFPVANPLPSFMASSTNNNPISSIGDESTDKWKYKLIYNKFPYQKSNYAFFRQYARNQYKMFVEPDDIDLQDDIIFLNQKQISDQKDDIRDSKGKKAKLDFQMIDKLLKSQSSSQFKQLVFRSNFESGNLDKVFIKKQQTQEMQNLMARQSLVLRNTCSTQGSGNQSLESSTHPKNEASLSQSPRNKRYYYLHLSNDTNTVGYNQFFYFKVLNPNYPRLATLNVAAQLLPSYIDAVFVIVNCNKKTIQNLQNIGIHAFSSKLYDRKIGWHTTKIGVKTNSNNNLKKNDNQFYHTLQFQYRVQARDIVYFSLTLPYTYTKLSQLIQKYPSNFVSPPSSVPQQLCPSGLPYLTTFSGNPLHIYQTGNLKSSSCILITARQHPSETSSSFVVQGIIKRLQKNSLLINLLKKRYRIVVLPMVNPDGVIHGNSRTNLLGFDVNRKWEVNPNKKHSYETYNFIYFVLKNLGKIQYLIDLHGHSKKLNTFAYFSTKRSIATTIGLQMAEKLPWFSISDCQMATYAPMNTLRWYATTNLQVQKAITIESSIHGWKDERKVVRCFKPQQLELTGCVLIDTISKIQLQKKSNIKSIRNIKFAECHQSSDSNPEGDYITNLQLPEKSTNQPEIPLKSSQNQKIRPERSQASTPCVTPNSGLCQRPSKLRIKTKTCVTNFYKPTLSSTIRQRTKTQYAVEKVNLNFQPEFSYDFKDDTEFDKQKMKRNRLQKYQERQSIKQANSTSKKLNLSNSRNIKMESNVIISSTRVKNKTIQNKHYKIKQKSISTIRKIFTQESQNQSLTFKQIRNQKSPEKQKQKYAEKMKIKNRELNKKITNLNLNFNRRGQQRQQTINEQKQEKSSYKNYKQETQIELFQVSGNKKDCYKGSGNFDGTNRKQNNNKIRKQSLDSINLKANIQYNQKIAEDGKQESLISFKQNKDIQQSQLNNILKTIQGKKLGNSQYLMPALDEGKIAQYQGRMAEKQQQIYQHFESPQKVIKITEQFYKKYKKKQTSNINSNNSALRKR